MQYREYGKTGKKISVLGFGGMRLPDDDQEAYLLVRRACEGGINYFDTAPSYCGWRSESIIGQAVKDAKKKVFLANKSMVDYDPAAGDLRKRLEISLKNMKAEKIDFYSMWDVSSWEKFERVTKKGGPYDGALKAKKEGLIAHITLSSHADSLTIKRMLESGFFEGVTLGYNLINADYRQGAIAFAAAKAIAVVTMNSLAGGVIPRIREHLDRAYVKNKLSSIAVALKFILMTPGITSALSGMNNIRELEENLSVIDGEINCDAGQAEAIKKTAESLGHRFCTYCWYCLPCPKNIPLP